MLFDIINNLPMLASIAPRDVGEIIAVILGLGGIGTGTYMAGKSRAMHLSNDPLNVKLPTEYATKAEFADLKKEIKEEIAEIEQKQSRGLENIFKRLNPMTENVAEIRGMLTVMFNKDSTK